MKRVRKTSTAPGRTCPAHAEEKYQGNFRKELVDEVDINRSTFYLHYTDIYQMLHKIEEEAMQNITEDYARTTRLTQVTRIPYCHLLSSSFPSWIKTVICA
ncbi:MAG: hypothetical protein ACLR6B_13100 [Blautia sp.]